MRADDRLGPAYCIQAPEKSCASHGRQNGINNNDNNNNICKSPRSARHWFGGMGVMPSHQGQGIQELWPSLVTIVIGTVVLTQVFPLVTIFALRPGPRFGLYRVHIAGGFVHADGVFGEQHCPLFPELFPQRLSTVHGKLGCFFVCDRHMSNTPS